MAVQARVRDLLRVIAHDFLVPGLRGLVRGAAGFGQLQRELDPVGIGDRHRPAVLASPSGLEQQRRRLGERDGRVVNDLPALVDALAPLERRKRLVVRLVGRALGRGRGRVVRLHGEYQIRTGKQDAAHDLVQVAGRGKRPLSRRRHHRSRRRGEAGNQRNGLLRRRVGTELGAAGGELTGLKHVRHDVGGLRARQLPRVVLRHRVLNLVDKLGHRAAPDGEEGIAGERRRVGARERRPVTGRALVLVHGLTAPGLFVAVDAVARRSGRGWGLRGGQQRSREHAHEHGHRKSHEARRHRLPPPISYATFWRSLSSADRRQARDSSVRSTKRTAKPNPGRP